MIVVIDGPRYSEAWGDSTGHTIPFQRSLLPFGVVYSNFRNEGPTETTSGHTALLTGVHQNINNAGQQLPQSPSLFQRWLKVSGADSTAAWIVTSKDKLQVLGNCLDTAWHNRWTPATDCGISGLGSGNREDSLTAARAIEILSAYHPTMMLIHFKEPDVSAHTGNWENYLAGLREADAYAGKIWNYLQSDFFYSGSTAFFLTNDHGRHLDSVNTGFSSHGDSCEGCRRIILCASGPDFVTNRLISEPVDQISLAPTVGRILHFDVTDFSGPVLSDLFLTAP